MPRQIERLREEVRRGVGFSRERSGLGPVRRAARPEESLMALYPSIANTRSRFSTRQIARPHARLCPLRDRLMPFRCSVRAPKLPDLLFGASGKTASSIGDNDAQSRLLQLAPLTETALRRAPSGRAVTQSFLMK